MKNYKLLLVLGSLIGGTAISSNGWSDIFLSYEFQEPRIEKIDDYYRVSIPEISSYGALGKPVLPIKAVCVLLPMGEEIASIDVKVYNKTEIIGSYKIEPGQLQVPISRIQEYKSTRHKVLPDSIVYSSANPFPGMIQGKGGSHRLSGYEIAHLYLYPVEYIPKTGKLSYYKRIEVNITTGKRQKAKGKKLFRGTNEVQNRVKSLVDNPDIIATYPSMLHSLKTDSFDYLIITDEEMAPLFEELRRFKTERGVKAEIAKVESIYAYCSGTDEQEKIRNFIIDMYATRGIKYVLLGGDDEIIPHRGFYDIINEDYPGYEIEDYDTPSDLYYGGLDGNWNTDGDDKWGEPDEADLYAEVFVGRASVDSDSEVINFIQKTITYQTTPEINNCTTAIMAGEDLHWDVWGGEYKEEIRNGSSEWGYTTVGFPDYFQVDTLYDRSLDPNRWNKDDLIPMLNSGPNLVNHLGHAGITYVMRIGNSDVWTRFTNTSYFIVHTQGCYSAAFDNRDNRGNYCPEDAIAESFTTIPNGAVCFIGNTRYGWGDGSSTNGASQRFDREFFDALFGEDIYPIGKALQDAKEDVAPYVNSSNVLRWCYYNLVLLGDPELQIWTDKPKTLTVTHSDSIIIGASSLLVNVMTDGNPVSGALVCVYQDSTIYARAYTNAIGNVTFPVTPANVGSLHIQVTAHNFLSYKEYLNVISSSSNVVYYKLEIDDDNIGASSGNNDSKVNPGEVIELPLWVRNLGLVEAHGVYGKISSTDSHITIQADSAYFGNILPMDTSLSSDNYVFTVAIGTPDKQRITFKLDCQDSLDSLWISYPEVRIYAPVLKYDNSEVNDTLCVRANGVIDPGEEVKLIVNLKNKGSATATGVTATIHTEDTLVTVIDSTATFSDILEDSILGNSVSPYVVFADSNIPIHHLINFSMYVTADGYEDTLQFVLRVGLGGDFLVWDPDPNYTSGPLLADALRESGYIGDYTRDLSEYRAYLPKYKAIFTCLGIFFYDYVLKSGPDVDSLCSYLEQGGNLYIEGGNAWYGDTLTLQEYFHIDFKNGGNNEIDTVTGISGTFTDSMRFNYFGENKSIDRIGGGNGAWAIFTNQPIPYTYGAAFRSGKYNTIGTSFEFGCLRDGITPSTRATLADSIMRWFLKPIQQDIAIWSIDSIPSDISPDVPINPFATVKNTGKSVESFSVICTIDSLEVIVYADTHSISNLPQDSSLQIEFKEWVPKGVAEYQISVMADLSDDEPANNERSIKTISFICIPEINSFYTQTPPTINGEIDTISEWAGVVPIDASDVFNKGGFGPYLPFSVYLYVMNDNSTLYLGIDARCDSSKDNMDGFLSFFDDNYDHTCPSFPDSSEGLLGLVYVMGADYIFYNPIMSDTSVEDYEVSINGASSDNIGWLQYEIAIPLGIENEYISASPGDSLGMHLVVGKLITSRIMDDCYGWWPQTVDEMGDPGAMGTIILGADSSEKLVDKLPKVFALSQNVPNPMREKTLIRYALPRDSKVELKVYNISGQLVRTLVNNREKAGYKTICWNGKDNHKTSVASGIYFYRLKIDDSFYVKTRKIVIAR